MNGPRPSARATRAGLVALAGIIAAVVLLLWWRSQGPVPAPPSPPAAGPLPAAAAARAAVVPSPVIGLDDRGDLLKVSHRDQSGRFPLEYVETPEGTVTIRRTYDAAGRVLKEEAYRGDQRVPMPAAR